MGNFVIAIPPNGRVKRITVPKGLKSPVTAILWGAGGGGGGADAQYNGGKGAAGQAYKVTFNVTEGDTIDVGVGQGGGAGSSNASSAAGGTGGLSYVDNNANAYKGGNGGKAGPGGSSGGGGAGGGATVLALNGTVIAVAAGGGGGSGSGNTGLFATGPSDYGTPTGWIAVTGASTWCAFMKTYAIWTGALNEVTTHTISTSFYAPTAGVYSAEVSVDNSATITVDNYPINTRDFRGTVTTSGGSISAGIHTINISVTNAPGGGDNPAGIAMTIKDPNGTIIWDTRRWAAGQYSYVYSLASGNLGGDDALGSSNPGSSTTGAAGTNKSGDGGGGGGGGGGKNGGVGGSTRSGDQGGYAGGTGTSWRHPSLTLSGTAYPSSGYDSPRVDSYDVSPAYGDGGSPRSVGKAGYALVIGQSIALPYVKEDDEWYPTTKVYVKVNSYWKDVSSVYVKVNGAWTPLTQSNTVTGTDLSAGVNYG